MLHNRVSAARGYLRAHDLDAILFTNLSNIRYLTGFTGSEGTLLLWDTGGCLMTDSRYTTQAVGQVGNFAVSEYREKFPAISSLLQERGARRIGFEADSTSFAFYRALADALPGVELLPLDGELDALRIVKDADEKSLLAHAASIASGALQNLLTTIEPGVTERELALSLEFAMRKAGADDKAFDFIVASGARGALPHGKATDKDICRGDLVTIDFGAVFHGYSSDETVTVAVGSPDSRQRQIYQIVKDAHDMALSAVRPGVSFKELDGVARNYIEKQGYGKYFGHGLGHGVGLDIHEKPTISFRGEGVVCEGMVFTIEPGIYVPEWGGVRIEDTVYVTGEGCEPLTKVPKDLMIL